MKHDCSYFQESERNIERQSSTCPLLSPYIFLYFFLVLPSFYIYIYIDFFKRKKCKWKNCISARMEKGPWLSPVGGVHHAALLSNDTIRSPRVYRDSSRLSSARLDSTRRAKYTGIDIRLPVNCWRRGTLGSEDCCTPTAIFHASGGRDYSLPLPKRPDAQL